MSLAADTDRIAAVRAFTRFYTSTLGVLDEGLLHTPYSVAEARVLYELAQQDEVGVADHVPPFGFAVPVVDVPRPGAQLVRRAQRLERLDRVPRVQPAVLARPDPDAGQVVREPVRALVKLAIGHLPVAADHRGTVAEQVGGMLEEVGEVQGHG